MKNSADQGWCYIRLGGIKDYVTSHVRSLQANFRVGREGYYWNLRYS